MPVCCPVRQLSTPSHGRNWFLCRELCSFFSILFCCYCSGNHMCCLFSFLSLTVYLLWKIDWETRGIYIAIFAAFGPFQLFSVKNMNISFLLMNMWTCLSGLWVMCSGGSIYLCSPVGTLGTVGLSKLIMPESYRCWKGTDRGLRIVV